ncbi:MAG: hypothetical protein ACW96X_02070 [Promethearchaeota archaeon]
MKDEKIREDLKQLRTQARSRVIVLISSLILIFLWFTNISWVVDSETFSRGAMAALARGLGMSTTYYIIPVTFIITVLFTIFYIILLKTLISSSLRDLKKP